MKTANEFLKELKKYVDGQVCRLDEIERTEFGDGSLVVYAKIQQKIEQFEAEQEKTSLTFRCCSNPFFISDEDKEKPKLCANCGTEAKYLEELSNCCKKKIIEAIPENGNRYHVCRKCGKECHIEQKVSDEKKS